MRIILNTFGSFGDIHPYMAIALELQRRGTRPSSQPCRAIVKRLRARVCHLSLSALTFSRRRNRAQNWSKDHGAKDRPTFPHRRTDLPVVRDSYADLLKASKAPICSSPARGAGWSTCRPQDRHAVGLDSPRPFSFYSSYDPPVPPFWQWTRKLSLLDRA